MEKEKSKKKCIKGEVGRTRGRDVKGKKEKEKEKRNRKRENERDKM